MKTEGERIVRVKFNPSNDEYIFQIKQKIASLIDEIDRAAAVSPDFKERTVKEFLRLKDLTITSLEQAAMYAVKMSTTKEDDE